MRKHISLSRLPDPVLISEGVPALSDDLQQVLEGGRVCLRA